ncbi:hypothetical protein ASG35_05585 [Burkholderia sp. Leaf177]|uniref:FHA domain-containing protein n=1 Tax=Burkholderia sp. Leaf177 TaxID=1736287 RepID=UPI0006FF546C|nr:FHA domain-containing protein [Burkholderia sp. Leaf177]KQR81756.1 hypothetical protein ASG35_05585 [Burkholderia sp. Leaf177]
MAADEAPVAEATASVDTAFDLVLEPESHPALGSIRVDEGLVAIGRAEAPFASGEADVIAQLSRRHARIFVEHGVAYAADLGSKNGTTVNGVALRERPVQLNAGDVIGFGGKLRYRVNRVPLKAARRPSAASMQVTLTPERDDLGLQPVEITQFPFLISKADATFAQHSERFPHQVNYLSRRHAHFFIKAGVPYVEDLGSTNGTFVDGKRLDDTASPLEDGASLAFGGNHFVYRVSVRRDEEPLASHTATVTGTPPSNTPVTPVADPDKTTFVTSADSFLDIFCVDPAAPGDDEINCEIVADARGPARPRSRYRAVRFVAELREALAGGPRDKRGFGRKTAFGALALALLVVLGGGLYWRGAAERDLGNLMRSGDYRAAAKASDAYLKGHPGDALAATLGTEASLKGYVPEWLAAVQSRDARKAQSVIGEMRSLAAGNRDARVLIDELDWMGRLEDFATAPGRERADPPIRIYADEDKIGELLKQWESDPGGHQRRLDRIASSVPAFREFYAFALSHLRKLESDDSVYLAAIERLKTSIATTLSQDDASSLEGEIADYADKYPRLAGLDALQADLHQYLPLDAALRARRIEPLIAAMRQAHFVTPPFKERLLQLQASALPSRETSRRYGAAADAWRAGKSADALAMLASIPNDSWSDAIRADIARKRSLADNYALLQKARGTPGYDERMLAFSESLDPAADVWFGNAIAPDMAALRQKALARADQWFASAQAAWTQYRANGAIGGEERLETGVSATFRKQAALLSGALADAGRAARLLHQLKSERAVQADQALAPIAAEADLQRRSLTQLRMVLEPGVLAAKLALIGPGVSNQGGASEERPTP